eukprot:Amastigsp_a845690_13.p4 type:complete len:140 gc:universal Amastigsp_a845690_13:1036-1455(+)
MPLLFPSVTLGRFAAGRSPSSSDRARFLAARPQGISNVHDTPRASQCKQGLSPEQRARRRLHRSHARRTRSGHLPPSTTRLSSVPADASIDTGSAAKRWACMLSVLESTFPSPKRSGFIQSPPLFASAIDRQSTDPVRG